MHAGAACRCLELPDFQVPDTGKLANEAMLKQHDTLNDTHNMATHIIGALCSACDAPRWKAAYKRAAGGEGHRLGRPRGGQARIQRRGGPIHGRLERGCDHLAGALRAGIGLG